MVSKEETCAAKASWMLAAPAVAVAAASLARAAKRRPTRAASASSLTSNSAAACSICDCVAVAWAEIAPTMRRVEPSTRASTAAFWYSIAPRSCASRESNCSHHRLAAASRVADASAVRSRKSVAMRSLEPSSPSRRAWPRSMTVSCSRSDAPLRRTTRSAPWMSTVSDSRAPAASSRSSTASE